MYDTLQSVDSVSFFISFLLGKIIFGTDIWEIAFKK